MEQKISALIGITGGIVDFAIGLIILQQPSSAASMMMETSGTQTSAISLGYSILALGAVVLFTGLYMLTVRMMQHRSGFGLLMILYGIIMLILGAGMIGQMFFVMQGSTFSGGLMIVVGLAMLYSGSGMVRK